MYFGNTNDLVMKSAPFPVSTMDLFFGEKRTYIL